MQLLLLFLAVSLIWGLAAARSDRDPWAWPLVLFSMIVAIGYLSQRII